MRAVLLLAICVVAVRANTEHRLLSDQLATFGELDRFVRPVQNISHPVIVDVNLTPTDLVHFRPHGGPSGYGTLKVATWIIQYWRDYHFGWDPSSYDNILRLSLPAELLAAHVWQPDIFPFTGEPCEVAPGDGAAYHHGHVITYRPSVINFSCVPDQHGLTTECTAKLGSWTHHKEEVDVGTPSFAIDDHLTMHPEWTVVRSSATREETTYDCCREVYVVAKFTLVLSPTVGSFHHLQHLYPHHHQN